MYMDSDECKQRLSDISCSLSKMLGFSCGLSWTIAPDSLQNVMKTLSEELKIVLPFESKSLKGLTNMWTFFEGEEAKSHLTKISETLSKIVDANVSLTASVVMDQFTKAVYERSKDNISSSIDAKVQGQKQLGNIQEKPEESLQEHAEEMKSEKKSPKPKRKEHDSKSRKKGAVGKLKDFVSSTFSFLQFKSYRNKDDGRTTYEGTADGNNDERGTTKMDISPSFESLKESGQVNKISSTKIKKTTYHVHTNTATLNFNQEHQGKRNLEIQNVSKPIDVEACLENVSANKPSPLPPQMQKLKVLELEMSQPDSGIHTIDQTYEKTQQ
ncbi:uncharacterized protein LOC128558223 isoform X2 [Mercenaria mercenaria]|uniref:uncharacterized protein LOC128558223 isoform X2 n=1 Tax=Mercenaria mercenaria TaxID=6596 RepID=UPI00234E3E67|nr:uncharacterized protein LOC128558223 isoform X2 [Mercenaria mercenaria]